MLLLQSELMSAVQKTLPIAILGEVGTLPKNARTKLQALIRDDRIPEQSKSRLQKILSK